MRDPKICFVYLPTSLFIFSKLQKSCDVTFDWMTWIWVLRVGECQWLGLPRALQHQSVLQREEKTGEGLGPNSSLTMAGCSVPGCSNSSRNKYKLYNFLKDKVRRKQWLFGSGSGNNDVTYGYDVIVTGTDASICHVGAHFKALVISWRCKCPNSNIHELCISWKFWELCPLFAPEVGK